MLLMPGNIVFLAIKHFINNHYFSKTDLASGMHIGRSAARLCHTLGCRRGSPASGRPWPSLPPEGRGYCPTAVRGAALVYSRVSHPAGLSRYPATCSSCAHAHPARSGAGTPPCKRNG